MRLSGWVLAALALTACTTDNPSYDPFYVPDGGSDLATSHVNVDHGTTAPVDLAMSPTCTDGERSCTGGGSAICENGSYGLDRACPDSSMCAMGYCQPPAVAPQGRIGHSCVDESGPSETTCVQGTQGNNAPSCQPFISDVTSSSVVVSWACDRPIGNGTPGVQCQSGESCRSGFCGSNGTCFRACTDDTDCPLGQGSTSAFQCQPVTFTVEGSTVQANSCIPI